MHLDNFTVHVIPRPQIERVNLSLQLQHALRTTLSLHKKLGALPS